MEFLRSLKSELNVGRFSALLLLSFERYLIFFRVLGQRKASSCAGVNVSFYQWEGGYGSSIAK